MKNDRQIGNTCNSYLIIPQIPPLRLPNRDDDRSYSLQTKCSNCRQSPEIHHLGEQAVILGLGIILWFAIAQIIRDEEGNPFLCASKKSHLLMSILLPRTQGTICFNRSLSVPQLYLREEITKVSASINLPKLPSQDEKFFLG